MPLVGDVPNANDADGGDDGNGENANTDENENEENGGAWWSAGKNLLADLGGLVHIERSDRPISPPLSAEMRVLTIEKIKLILESCKLAFVREQRDIYQSRMTAARSAVVAHFDVDSPEVNAWLAQWAALAVVNPQVELPDISASTRALREVRR